MEERVRMRGASARVCVCVRPLLNSSIFSVFVPAVSQPTQVKQMSKKLDFILSTGNSHDIDWKAPLSMLRFVGTVRNR